MTILNHYWAPIKEVTDYVNSLCDNYKDVLEIGPGTVPFKSANRFIGYNEKVDYLKVDIDTTIFPFEESEFDFIYCRHVLEDIQNPDFAAKEIFRTGKHGYIETPSPMAEITRGVESNYCGYIHHRYIIWSYLNTIYFLPKYPLVEYINNNEKLVNLLNSNPFYWNNYCFWNKETKIIVYKNGVNMEIREDYVNLINRALNESILTTDELIQIVIHK